MNNTITLMNGDCLEEMKKIPDGSVDMVLCDLPYGTTVNEWDKVIDLEKLWEQYHRCVKPNGVFALFCQIPFSIVLGMSNLKELRYEYIWTKNRSTGFLNAQYNPLKIHENIFIFYRKRPTYNPIKREGFSNYFTIRGYTDSTNYNKIDNGKRTITKCTDGTRFPIDVLHYDVIQHTLHPTEKPVELCEYLIKTFSNENDTILDNCMGSGTTGIACIKTNRNFIGIEMNETYYKIAQDRIDCCKNTPLNDMQLNNDEVKIHEQRTFFREQRLSLLSLPSNA